MRFSLICYCDFEIYIQSTSRPLSYYVGGYTGLSMSGIVAAFVASMLIVYGAYLASKNLHIAMLRNITRCSLR